MTTAPIAVFDLDGTLADTAHDLVATLNVILGQEGLPPLPIEAASDMISAGGRGLLERGFEVARREPTPALIEELYRRFLAYYGDNLCVETRLYPGVLDALDRLERDGFRLAICTNKMEAHSVKLLRALGVAERFATICGRDTFPWFKPDARHLTMTIARAGGDPRRAVMVGDSLFRRRRGEGRRHPGRLRQLRLPGPADPRARAGRRDRPFRRAVCGRAGAAGGGSVLRRRASPPSPRCSGAGLPDPSQRSR